MAEYTPYCGFHQWDPGDSFLRTDFNTDFAKMDAALKGLADRPEPVSGAYTGDGAAARTVSLGFFPRALLVFTSEGYSHLANVGHTYGGLALPGRNVTRGGGTALSLTEDGFRVHFDDDFVQSNRSGETYYYLAWR